MWCKNYEFSQQGALCEKDRGWWQREGEPLREGLQLVSVPNVCGMGCVGRGVCGAHMQARERGLCACVCESTHLSRPRRSKRVGTEIKGKIK